MENQNLPNKDPQAINPESKRRVSNAFWELVYGLTDFLKQMFELESDLDRKGTIDYIKNNKRMQGANVWLLICSIMVASLGLDLNSPAVIIGAMLISPLMSPILGVGLGVGINDKETLYISARHFGLSIIVALITSVIYFKITPYGNYTPEIDARTVPTFLDAMVAVFGGLAGIISSSRKDKSNAIPGVAIATALMPPLCVAGYGIAKWDWSIFINSFYLFFLNSVLIAITTYTIVRFLNFPFKIYQNKRDKLRTSWSVAIFSILVILPSAFILARTINDIRLENAKVEKKKQIETYVKNQFDTEERKIVMTNIQLKDTINAITSNSVTIDYYVKEGVTFNSDSIINLYQDGIGRILGEKPIVLLRGRKSDRLPVPVQQTGETNAEFNERLNEFTLQEAELNEEISRLNNIIDSLENNVDMTILTKQTQILVPQLKEMYFTEHKLDKDVPLLLVGWKNDNYRSKDDVVKIRDFVKLTARLDTLVVRRSVDY